ncbi:MAG: hypothetical protein [Inoviridae sp.]|nr:MAG: hypothetical protein [Inoviridae sp.]
MFINTEVKKVFSVSDKFNCRMKVYPDGTYNAVTANQGWFLNGAQRLELREKRAQEHEKYMLQMEEMNKGILQWAKACNPEYEPCAVSFAEPEPLETNKIIEEVIQKAIAMGIPVHCNGVRVLRAETEVKKPDAKNVRRARERIFDMIMLNEFRYFATFTFNPRKVDSFNADAVLKVVKKWIDNHQQRNNLKYVMVPEYHKSGRIHLHMLYSGNLKLKDSGKRTKTGKTIYNCKSWRYGYSTVIPCDDEKAKLAYYVSKYVTKDVQRIFGKYYYSSQGLKRECPVVYCNRDYQSIQSPSVYVDAIDVRFKYDSSFQYSSSDASPDLLKDLGLEAV